MIIVTGINDESLVFNNLISLAECEVFTFYQTGSRAFGWAKPNSDYDFYVQDSKIVHLFLENLGFKELSGEYADKCNDLNTVAIYRYINIDVVCCRDADMRTKVQNALMKRYSRPWPKSEARNIWDMCYEVLGLSKPDKVQQTELIDESVKPLTKPLTKPVIKPVKSIKRSDSIKKTTKSLDRDWFDSGKDPSEW